MKKIVKFDKESGLEYSLNRLSAITNQIKVIATLVMMIFFIDIISVIYLVLNMRYMNRSFYSSGDMMISVLPIFFLSFFGLTMLHMFETIKKKGMSIYDLLVEEVEWRFKSETTNDNINLFNTKSVLKQFIVNSDLPFVSGNNGKTVYFILYILILMIKIYITMAYL